MKCSNILSLVLLAGAMVSPLCIKAQSTDTDGSKKQSPFHYELSANLLGKYKQIQPLGISIDVSYTFAKIFSAHAVLDNTFYIPQYGTTSNFNHATNLGGGLGVELFPTDHSVPGKMELRGFVTTTVGRSDYKNTAYNLGIYWYGSSSLSSGRPVVGLGYTIRDFSNRSLPTYYGPYASFGIRF